MKIIRIFALAVIIVLATLTTGASSASAGQRVTEVTTYETPCQHQARVARGIPAYSVHEGRGLLAYVRAHLNGTTPDPALADFWDALDACARNAPVARWDWGSMVVARVEYLG